MPVTSNLYADYILGQHPIALWTLDETLSGTTTNIGSSGLGLYSTSTVNAYEAETYNYTGTTGYYISSKTSNASFPMIYGSSNATSAGSQGAIILPAFGFLNSTGKYNTYTFETWLKIGNVNTSDIKKLISCFIDYASESDDSNGLYFNDTSFILRVGNNYGTHYIKDFNKPMLLQLIYSPKSLSLIVNGESLIELLLSPEDILNLRTTDNYIMLSNAYYDTATIYNYQIDRNQATTNYVQGLQKNFPNEMISKYDGQGFHVDYQFEKSSNQIKFPNSLSGYTWTKAVKNNIDTKELAISNKQYPLPKFNFSNSTGSQEILEAAGTFRFKTSTWSTAEANIRFESMNILENEKVKGFYLDGTYTSLPATQETIFKIIDKKSKNYFRIAIDSSDIYYYFRWGTAVSETELRKESLPAINGANYNFLAGIDIDTFVKNYPVTRQFFTNTSELVVYVGGEETLSANTTLTASISSVKFLNFINLKQKTALVNPSGVFVYPSNGVITNTISSQNAILGSYELDLYNNTTLGKHYFTVATSGYWKTHIPLQSLARYTRDSAGVQKYSLDFIQFNIDYAAPLTKVQVGGNWIFDTIVSSPYLKTYITFEKASAIYKEDSYFTTQVSPNINRVVNPVTVDANDFSWLNYKYQVVDDFIIYLPSNIDISNYYILISIEISIPDTLYNKIEVKSLELEPKTLFTTPSVPNPIRLAKDSGKLEPYTYTIVSNNPVYNYRTKNPYIVNKQTQQYLQLSRQSGLRLVGDYTVGEYRGLKYKVNESGLDPTYNISALQLFTYYEGLATRSGSTITKNYFSSTPVEIFQIESKTKNIKFYITSTTPGVDTETGRIYSVTDTGVIDDNIQYSVNGVVSANPQIKANEWTCLGIVFIDKLIFDSYDGYIAFTGPISFDNVSFYQLITENNIQSLVPRTWNNILNTIGNTSTYTWNSWISNIWNDLTVTGTVSTSAIGMPTLYNIFVGTNRLLSDAPESRDISVLYESNVYYDATVNQTNTYSAL
jgi:hypothetical protein